MPFSVGDCPEMSVYIEYLNLDSNLPGLLQDLMRYSSDKLQNITDFFSNGKPYLWFGDGNTVGKLHFDAFDNILIQMEGSKTFRVVDPGRNERFYEGHMRESMLEMVSLNEESSDSVYSNPLLKLKFRKQMLLESTSMVHSPIDILNADVVKYPLAQNISYVDCIVHDGDAIYLPSFYWHEVISKPGKPMPFSSSSHDVRMNAALNYWFDPVFEKEFPCSSCRKKINYESYSIKLKQLFASPKLGPEIFDY
jgi:jumonji domain-containing protein 7